MVKSAVAVAALLVCLGSARAAEPPPTTPEQFEASRRAYAEGAAAYERGAYDTALEHFQNAYDLAPSPEFWFNIARCHERLGRWAEAANAYERYLAGKPTVEDAVQIRERISDLHVRAAELSKLRQPPPAPAPVIVAPTPRPSLRVPALAMLGVTVALAAGGTGAYLSEWSDYQSQKSACQGQCSPSQLDGLRTRVLAAEVAGGVLWSLAGAALVADVILWIADGKRAHHERLSAALAGQVQF
jgi:tetratricopeptide (TPR) repeat protein